MIKTLNLTTGLYDDKIGVLADNENLHIKIVGRLYDNVTYYLKARNGEFLHELKFVDRFIEIPRKKLMYGLFKAKVVAFVGSKKIKEFDAEDLILEEVGGEIKVLPEIEQLKDEFNEVIKEVVALREMCENTKELVIKLNGLVEKVGV